ERLLVAAGRSTGLDRLGLETVGLDPSEHTLEVDEYCRVRGSDGEVLADLYAIGDVTGRGPFTHMSIYQAQVALGHLTGSGTYPAEYHAVPRVTFTEPEVGAVGMTQAQAEQREIPVRVATAELPSSPRGWIHSEGNSGFITLVGHSESGVLLGATSVGPTGGEVLSMLTLAVDQGVTVPALATMIYAYPPFHRAVLTAAQQWQADVESGPNVAEHRPQSCAARQRNRRSSPRSGGLRHRPWGARGRRSGGRSRASAALRPSGGSGQGRHSRVRR